jgi:hypothetical protein
MIPKLEDDSILQFGKEHKGSKLANVPASYLIWIYENCRLPDNLKAYILENMDVLKTQVKRSVKNERR